MRWVSTSPLAAKNRTTVPTRSVRGSAFGLRGRGSSASANSVRVGPAPSSSGGGSFRLRRKRRRLASTAAAPPTTTADPAPNHHLVYGEFCWPDSLTTAAGLTASAEVTAGEGDAGSGLS